MSDERIKIVIGPERRYTLDEARKALELEKCKTQGHDYDIVSEWPYCRPAQVLCSRCGRSWAVAEEKP